MLTKSLILFHISEDYLQLNIQTAMNIYNVVTSVTSNNCEWDLHLKCARLIENSLHH